MILIHLDGAGPLGDPYQVDSANHGPFGAAIVHELIPYVEANFRGIGRAHARVLDGGSTGGWVALALQIFYPETFNGAWAFCPDSVDFRSFQLVNIYDDDNAYINRHGFERPAARDVSGEVRYTMRHECQLENVLGQGDSWALSGGQWGAWNATYGPKGPDGRPVPLWNPATGAIDHKAAAHWKTYDLRRVLEENWASARPQAQGKAPHLGRRGRRLLPQQRRPPARHVSVPRPSAVQRLDHLRSRTGPLLDGDLPARHDEADGPAHGLGDQNHHPDAPIRRLAHHVWFSASWSCPVVARTFWRDRTACLGWTNRPAHSSRRPTTTRARSAVILCPTL